VAAAATKERWRLGSRHAKLRGVTAADVLEVLTALERSGVRCLLDGGWGIDALAGAQTREHADVDLAIERRRLDDAVAALSAIGYSHDPTASPGLPARYALRDASGRQVDFHLLTFDDAGNGWQQLTDAGAWGIYPAGERVTGRIDGAAVTCISAELQHRFHLGWEWDEKAIHDLRLLHERFATPLPPAYAAR
jgi:lincosamide nucleotidyltransferase A/C/D/E